jgi:hypothetical protein
MLDEAIWGAGGSRSAPASDFDWRIFELENSGTVSTPFEEVGAAAADRAQVVVIDRPMG